jgi:dihydrodipicolinate synthase/N-acetylneuraminate lyase
MLTREQMKGLYVLPITPFDDNFNLDETACRDNIRKLVDLGIDGIITSGTNGEFHTTTDDERNRIARILVEETKGKTVAAVVGASGVNTAESIQRTKYARDAGADAVMNVVPFYHILSKAEVYRYFEDLSAACPDIGIIIYNNPQTTQVALDENDFKRLEKIPNIVGAKLTADNYWLYSNCLRLSKLNHFPLEPLWGVSKTLRGTGVLASFLYAFPSYMMRWWKTISENDLPNALKMQDEVNGLLSDVVIPVIVEGYNEIAATKALVDAAGFFKAGPPRKPFLPVPQDRLNKLRNDIKEQYPQFLK